MTLKELLQHFYFDISQNSSSVTVLENCLERKRSDLLASKRIFLADGSAAFIYYKELDHLYCKAFDIYDKL